MSILNLPSELIGDIAAFSGAGSAGNLWCCGSRLLNAKIASRSGMRVYALRSGFKTITHVPRFVHHLQGLKQISVGHLANLKVEIPSDFFHCNFHSEVESISVRVYNPMDGWIKSIPRWYFWSTRTAVDFETHFPRLHTLVLACEKSLSKQGSADVSLLIRSLPSTLTSLTFIPNALDDNRDIVMSLPHLQKLTLGFREIYTLDFVFSLPSLKSLSLPRLEVIRCIPTTDIQDHPLVRLDIPRLGHTYGFENRFPRLLRITMTASVLTEHLFFHERLYTDIKITPPSRGSSNFNLDLLPRTITSLDIEGLVLLEKVKSLWQMPNLIRVNARVWLGLKHPGVEPDVLPSSMTWLACYLPENDPSVYQLIHSNIVHLSGLNSSLGSIPLDLLPNTLSTVQFQEDIAVNAEKLFPKWEGRPWISTDATFDTDDVFTFDYIWSYFKPDDKELIAAFATKAIKKKCSRILASLTAKDTFWNAIRSKYHKRERLVPTEISKLLGLGPRNNQAILPGPR